MSSHFLARRNRCDLFRHLCRTDPDLHQRYKIAPRLRTLRLRRETPSVDDAARTDLASVLVKLLHSPNKLTVLVACVLMPELRVLLGFADGYRHWSPSAGQAALCDLLAGPVGTPQQLALLQRAPLPGLRQETKENNHSQVNVTYYMRRPKAGDSPVLSNMPGRHQSPGTLPPYLSDFLTNWEGLESVRTIGHATARYSEDFKLQFSYLRAKA